MRRNIAIIIGAMKCGTTSLFHYLSQHPQIISAKIKEPHFFSDDPIYEKGIDWYYSLWNWQDKPDLNLHQIALEASTTYTMHPKYPHVVERMEQVKDANFQFIYIIRNPLDRIESHLRHLLSGGYRETTELIDEYFEFSEYTRQLDLYVNAFGRDHIYLLLLEDLQTHPEVELKRLCKFIDIDADYSFQNLNLVLNSQKTLTLHPTIRQIYEIPVIRSVASLVPPTFRQKLYQPLSRKDKYDIQFSEAQRTQIIQRLQPDLVRLQTEYNIDIKAKWGLDI